MNDTTVSHECSICKEARHGKKESLRVDYDHVTGKVRGLLCQQCNLILGKAKYSIKTIEGAVKYLIAHQSKSLEIGELDGK